MLCCCLKVEKPTVKGKEYISALFGHSFEKKRFLQFASIFFYHASCHNMTV